MASVWQLIGGVESISSKIAHSGLNFYSFLVGFKVVSLFFKRGLNRTTIFSYNHCSKKNILECNCGCWCFSLLGIQRRVFKYWLSFFTWQLFVQMRVHREGSLAFPWPPYEISAVSKTSNLPWHPFQREGFSLITTQAEIIKPSLCSPEFIYLKKESEREDTGVRLCCARTFAWQCLLIDPSLSWHSCPARSESSWMTESAVKRSEVTLSRLHLWWEIMSVWSVTCSPISDRVSCAP